MANQTDNYGLSLPTADENFNPLIPFNTNMEEIDKQMKENANNSITTATELKTGTVHAITRKDGDVAVMRWKATSNFESGETFTVDGVQVTALLTTGQTLTTGAYIIGSEVVAVLNGTLLTIIASGASNALDSDRLGGQLPTYYGTAEAVEKAQTTANAAGETANSNATKINELNASLTKSIGWTVTFVNGITQFNVSKATGERIKHVLSVEYIGTSDNITFSTINALADDYSIQLTMWNRQYNGNLSIVAYYAI